MLAFWSIVRSVLLVRRPNPKGGEGAIDHRRLAEVLAHLSGRPDDLPEVAGALDDYVASLASVDPDRLVRTEALAFWLNLYNAAALLLAAEAGPRGETSVLRIPGAFRRPVVTVAGERLSLDGIEHGKVRRFEDPRVHAALVCGSMSCPTLRPEPYVGERLEDQLDDQMRRFLAGGAVLVTADTVHLSRVFLWFGADFVFPERMPTFRRVPPGRVLESLKPWLPEGTLLPADLQVRFQAYDWSLGCKVG